MGVSVVLQIGHTELRGGAKNKLTGINEYTLNSLITPQIQERLSKLGISSEIISGAYWRLPTLINKLEPKLCLSLHCNGFKDPSVGGKEFLYHHKSSKGKKFAEVLSKQFEDFYVNDRGIKPRVKGDRGFRLLDKTKCPIVIAELIFITNNEDLHYFVSAADDVIRSYTQAIHRTLRESKELNK